MCMRMRNGCVRFVVFERTRLLLGDCCNGEEEKSTMVVILFLLFVGGPGMGCRTMQDGHVITSIQCSRKLTFVTRTASSFYCRFMLSAVEPAANDVTMSSASDGNKTLTRNGQKRKGLALVNTAYRTLHPSVILAWQQLDFSSQLQSSHEDFRRRVFGIGFACDRLGASVGESEPFTNHALVAQNSNKNESSEDITAYAVECPFHVCGRGLRSRGFVQGGKRGSIRIDQGEHPGSLQIHASTYYPWNHFGVNRWNDPSAGRYSWSHRQC